MAAPELNLPLLLGGWCLEIQIFRDLENDKNINGAPTDQARQEHKQVLALLISRANSYSPASVRIMSLRKCA